jgi:acyl-CoA dehydrogenase
MDYPGSERLPQLMASLDRFIDEQLQPLEARDDNARFFDHRREYARTDWERDGQPHADWEALLAEARRLAREAGFLALALPGEYGGGDASNLEMAVLREHLAARGIGLHCDLQNEHCIVGNFPTTLAFRDFGSAAQREAFIPGSIDGSVAVAFGLTEPEHGSDATWLETRAVRPCARWHRRLASQRRKDVDHRCARRLAHPDFRAQQRRRWQRPGYHLLRDARGQPGFSHRGVAVDLQHAHGSSARQPARRVVAGDGYPRRARAGGWRSPSISCTRTASARRRRAWVRRATASPRAWLCAKERHTFGKPLASNQSIQFRLAELHGEYQA